MAAHDWLVANGPSGPGAAKATFVAGDSAGGNLSLATLLALKERARPLPAGAIAISPGTDFTLSSQSLKSVYDPIISSRTMPEFRDRYLSNEDRSRQDSAFSTSQAVKLIAWVGACVKGISPHILARSFQSWSIPHCYDGARKESTSLSELSRRLEVRVLPERAPQAWPNRGATHLAIVIIEKCISLGS